MFASGYRRKTFSNTVRTLFDYNASHLCNSVLMSADVEKAERRGKIANPCVWPKIKDLTQKCLHPSRIHYLPPALYSPITKGVTYINIFHSTCKSQKLPFLLGDPFFKIDCNCRLWN